MQKILDRPDWAPLLIIWKRNKNTVKNFIRIPLELSCVTCTGIIGTCKLALEVSVSHGLMGTRQSHTLAIKTI